MPYDTGAAFVAILGFALAAAFVIVGEVAYHQGKIAAHAEMLDAATSYHVTRRIVEADTQPSILALLDVTHPLPAIPTYSPPPSQPAAAAPEKHDAAQQPLTATARRA